MTPVRGSLADLPTVARAWRLRDDKDAAEHQLALADLGISGQSRELVDEVSSRRVVVLLGEPGFGKSRELDRMAARANALKTACQRVNLGGYGENQLLAELNGSAVQAAKQGTDAFLLLDGLEESRLGIRHVSELLARTVQELPPRVHVLLTCRTAAWPAALERDLRSKVPDLSVVELLPLTRQQVDHLARAAGLDPTSFRQMVADAGVEDLTRTPMLLRLLLREALKNGPGDLRLPSTRAGLFASACHTLAREPSEYPRDRDTVSDPDEVLSVASYLAVLGVLGTTTAIFRGDPQDAPAVDLPASLCVPAFIRRWGGATGVTTDAIEIRERHVEQALGTALFAGRGENRFWFVHQSLGEYLAARHVVESGVPPARIRSLLGGRHGMVAPQVQAVAAWLVALRPGDYRPLIEEDPQAFVRSGDPAG